MVEAVGMNSNLIWSFLLCLPLGPLNIQRGVNLEVNLIACRPIFSFF